MDEVSTEVPPIIPPFPPLPGIAADAVVSTAAAVVSEAAAAVEVIVVPAAIVVEDVVVVEAEELQAGREAAAIPSRTNMDIIFGVRIIIIPPVYIWVKILYISTIDPEVESTLRTC